MRNMPQIPEAQKNIRMTNSFQGYNHNEIIKDSECYEMKNLGGDAFPAMTVRKARTSKSWTGETLEAIHGRAEDLVLIRDGHVYFGDTDTGLTVSSSPNMIPKQIVSMGSYIVIWPDKIYYNTSDPSDKGSMERNWYASEHVTPTGTASAPADAPTACICTGDGTEYDLANITRSYSAPSSPTDGQLWIDVSGKDDVMRQYSAALQEWQEVPTVYLKLAGEGIGEQINDYDAVTISGLEYTYDQSAPVIGGRVEKQLETLNGDFVVYTRDDDYIIVIGMLSKACTLNERTLRVDRKAPDLDYLCEANNRLWGCKYGKVKDAETYCTEESEKILVGLDTRLYGTIYEQGTEPENPTKGDLWIDTSSDPVTYNYTVKLYQGEPGWSEETPTVKIIIDDDELTDRLIKDQYIEINGMEYDNTGTENPVLEAQVNRLNGRKKVISFQVNQLTDEAEIVIEGLLPANTAANMIQPGPTGKTIYIDKVDSEQKFLNELHASALGDFKNWNKYMGLSTDSYTASIGTDGPFTGCIKQGGYPVFFKEDCIHRVYGMNPDSFQVQTTMCEGIQQGSWRSAASINETIYYKSRYDIMAYDGNMPRSISEALGQGYYSDARAGAYNDQYYVSMKKGDTEKYELFCYDTEKGIWFKEDSTKAMGFGRTREELYYIDEANNTLVSVNGRMDGMREDAEAPISWGAVFGISGIEYTPGRYGYSRGDMTGHMYLSRFDLRMYIEEDAEMDMYIEYDSSGQWEHQGTIKGRKRKTFLLPVKPKRCDHLRMKLTGKGTFRLYSISRIMEVGSDG